MPAAPDLYVGRQRDLFRKCQNKLNLGSDFKILSRKKIQPAEADVARLTLPLGAFRPGFMDGDGQRHRKTSGSTAFGRRFHIPPWVRCVDWPQTSIEGTKSQSES